MVDADFETLLLFDTNNNIGILYGTEKDIDN